MTPKARCQVALLEGQADYRAQSQAVLAQDEGLDLVWAGSGAADCLDWLRRHRPNVLLVDLDLPGQRGLDVIRSCRERHPDCDLLVHCTEIVDAHLLEALAMGASGCLLKDGHVNELPGHVRSLRAGGSPISPPIARRLLKSWRSDWGVNPAPATPAAPIVDLSVRETDVLGLMARGFSVEEVAASLQLSACTVRTHVRKLYDKLDVHSRTEAVFEARALGLLR